MCLVLEEEEPVLVLPVNIYLDLDGTSVDLFRLIKTGKLAHGLKIPAADGGEVHKRYGLSCAAELLAETEIFLISICKLGISYIDIIDGCQKCGVSAVIRPVCIEYAHLCESGIAVLALKVVLKE